MKSFSASIEIARPPEAIWAVLTDASSYAEWATGVHRLEGEIKEGAILQLYTSSKPDRPMPLRVSNLVRPQTFTLSGGLPFNLFRGDRTLTLTPQPDGTTEFSMCEVFGGLLSPLMSRMIPDLTESFESYVAGLKQKCER
ncbi:MAG: SRPBCC domain-containing protein [Cyanobacteria bacterium J06638_28]